MPDKRSTETVRKRLNTELAGIGKVGLSFNLTTVEEFTEDARSWLQANTTISSKTLDGADYGTLLEELKEQLPSAPVEVEKPQQSSFDDALQHEVDDEYHSYGEDVQKELDDLPYSTPVPGPKGRPWIDKAAFHGIAGEIVEYISPDEDADPAGMLATLLSSFSVMVGAECFVRGPVEQHVNVWHILMGETGEGRKGGSAERAMKVMRKVNRTFFKKNATSSLSSGEGLIYSVRDGMDEDEISRREENGHRVDYGVEDKRLLVFSTEFATVMQKTHGSTLGPVLRDAWDGRDLNIQTMNAEVATEPHITVIGHVTPQEFADRQKPTEMAGGTWNRFMPFFVHQTKELTWPEDPEDWEERLDNFGDRLRDAAHRAGTGKVVVTFSKEAQLFYRKTIFQEYKSGSSDSAIMKQFTQRRLPHLVRVAGTYALMNERREVSLEDLQAAKAVVDYAIQSARFVLERYMMGGSAAVHQSVEEKEASDKAILSDALLKAGGEGLTKTHIQQKTLKFRRKKDQIAGFIDDLGAVVVKVGSGGRPTEHVYHPEFAPKESE